MLGKYMQYDSGNSKGGYSQLKTLDEDAEYYDNNNNNNDIRINIKSKHASSGNTGETKSEQKNGDNAATKKPKKKRKPRKKKKKKKINKPIDPNKIVFGPQGLLQRGNQSGAGLIFSKRQNAGLVIMNLLLCPFILIIHSIRICFSMSLGIFISMLLL